MLKLKLQYFGHLMRRADSLGKTLVLGGIGGRRRRGRQRMRRLDGLTHVHHQLDGTPGVNSGSWWWTGKPGMVWFMGSQRVGHNWATELNWTERQLKCFPGGSDPKESVCNAGDLGSITVLGKSPIEGNGNPFQHFGLACPLEGALLEPF